jgi:glucose/mannose-6-phosphate isomerase
MTDKKLISLDSPETYLHYDSQGMLSHLRNFPGLCQQAWKIAQDFKLPEDFSEVNKVLILGMGGSAIGGDLVGGLVQNEAGVLVRVCRDYTLPGFVDERTLVIASSYSGNTEETLAAFKQSLATPAKKLAITTGGELKALCVINNVAAVTFDYRCPPRAALPFSFFILLGLLQKAGLIKDYSPEITGTVQNLVRMASKINEKVASPQNMAKVIAGELHGRLAVIYGAEFITEVARRWKGQINEVSKQAAYYEYFSELNHNSVVGYPLPVELTSRTQVVMLDSTFLHPRIRLRYEITQKLLGQAGIPYHRLMGEGDTPLSQMMSLVLLGDYVSYYLAMLNQTDPTPVTAIDFLKNSLAGQ